MAAMRALLPSSSSSYPGTARALTTLFPATRAPRSRAKTHHRKLVMRSSSALFLLFVSLYFPETTRLTGWYAGCTWWVIIITALLTGYGVYFSTGGRPFGEGTFLEE
ncbi:MAG: hypothetical protein AB1714_23685 [Acidobacteriota bacterium]